MEYPSAIDIINAELDAMRSYPHEWPINPADTTTVIKNPGKKKPSLSYYDRKSDKRASKRERYSLCH